MFWENLFVSISRILVAKIEHNVVQLSRQFKQLILFPNTYTNCAICYMFLFGGNDMFLFDTNIILFGNDMLLVGNPLVRFGNNMFRPEMTGFCLGMTDSVWK